MVKPIILAVDDEPQVLNAIERDLRRRYSRDYRVVKAASGSDALEATRTLKQRNEPVALFVADQRMPQITGIDFLAQAIKLYPDARKVLLTAYADTEAAIASINQIGLDYYLLKPWHPPDEHLYPVLDDLLDDWQATVSLPYDGIRVAGTLWSPGSHLVKDFLSRNRIPYQWLDIEMDSEAAALVEVAARQNSQENGDSTQSPSSLARLPVVFFPDGATLIAPDNRTLAERVGMQTRATQPFYDLVIVGAGPAGLGAAVYGASEGLRTALIEKQATGGQAGTSSRIENYLGFPNGLSGVDLARRATTQSIRFGAEILTTQEAVGVAVEGPYRIATLDDGSELSCHALLIATGVSVRKLELPGIDKFLGAGVYYGAAMTEAAHYRDESICVVGGANSAGQGAMFFSRYARNVTMLVRGTALENSMSQYLVDQIYATENIEVRVNTRVTGVEGDNRLQAVVVKNSVSGEQTRLPVRGMFVFIGAAPHSECVAGVVDRDADGFIITGQDLLRDGKRPKGWTLERDPFHLETSVPGIFAAGDVRYGAQRRVASAVGEGAVAIGLIHQYLKTV